MSWKIKMEEYFPPQREAQTVKILKPFLATMRHKDSFREELIELQENLGIKQFTTAFLSQNSGVTSWKFFHDYMKRRRMSCCYSQALTSVRQDFRLSSAEDEE